MIATDGVGPPGPEMRSPSGKLGRREVSIERTTIDIYPAAAQLSSALSRLTDGPLQGQAKRSSWRDACGNCGLRAGSSELGQNGKQEPQQEPQAGESGELGF